MTPAIFDGMTGRTDECVRSGGLHSQSKR